jgi:hypothetical protein
MAILSSTTDVDAAQTKSSWFTRPLAGWACVLGWCVAAGVFVAGVAIPGGPAVGDAWEIIYPTWAISHGQLVCVYPPHPESISTFAAPMYPIIAGAIGFVTRIGHNASFPSGTALGHGCSKAVVGMIRWSQHGGAVEPTLRTGYVAGLFLLVGLILLLRATVRGRTGWEPAGLVLVACVPPVWFCIEMYAHPQDVVALGFALAAMACALRNRWVWAGILIALAVLTQQYTLLVAIPILVVAPSARRLPYVLAAIATAAVVAAPLLIATSGTAAHSIFAGSGASGGIGGTVMWELHVRSGASLVLASRLPPLVLSLALSWYVLRRLGASALQPAVLMALVAVSLSFRLVFEDNIFSYYYMALAVSLVVLDVLRGHIRQRLVAWVAMVTLIYTEPTVIVWRQSWDESARHWIPVIVIIVGLLLIIRDVLRHAVGRDAATWTAAVVTALIVWPVSSDPLPHEPITWLWQVILVGIGVALAAGPLVGLVREHSAPEPQDQIEPASLLS